MPTIVQDFDLSDLNTFAVPARALHFLPIESIDELQAIQQSISSFEQRLILGGGSNMLFVEDYPGLIIYPQIFGIDILSEDADSVVIQVGASENWHQLVVAATERGWFGLENLALIPGTVGAAPVQNIGAYGVEIESFIQQVEYFDIASGEMKQAKHKDCEFAYRDSVFKRAKPGTLLITRVQLRLLKQPRLSLEYQPLAEYFKQHKATPKTVMQKVIEVRQQKLPDPQKLANAGSFFKNPLVGEQVHEELKQRFPKLVSYPQTNGFKLAAGWLIDNIGLKGYEVNGVGVHKHQALVLVNYASRPGQEVWQLALEVRRQVWQTYGVILEPEVRVIGSQVVEDLSTSLQGGSG